MNTSLSLQTPARPDRATTRAAAAGAVDRGGLDREPRRQPSWARWPWPALWVWGCAWACTTAAGAAGLPAGARLLLGAACALAGALAWPGLSRWRRGLLAAGYPLALLLLGLGEVPAWAWLLPLAALLPLYPVHAWRDAPLFPTPREGLQGLAQRIPLPARARVLDAGCGTGDGLRALAREFPQARLHGVEHSVPLAALARWRCQGAHIRRGDMWARSWQAYELVYLFQRPESMAHAWAKAQAEMCPGRWLVSLEFTVPGQRPWATLEGAGRRPVHIYRIGAASGVAKDTDTRAARPKAGEGGLAHAVSVTAAPRRRSRPGPPRR